VPLVPTYSLVRGRGRAETWAHVSSDGFPLAYEVLAGNTSDKTTLADFLAKIEAQYGTAQRVWIMDRGIPSEETLARCAAPRRRSRI
jgi:hypothetical protein